MTDPVIKELYILDGTGVAGWLLLSNAKDISQIAMCHRHQIDVM